MITTPTPPWARREVAELVERDRRTVWHPYAPMPATLDALPVVGASGVRLQLADGRRLIDGMSSWWAAIWGYRHPVIDAAVRSQLDAMAHVMFGGLTHPGAVELAERLVALTPVGLDHVFFADSGSVAVEVALKMAYQYWRGRDEPGRDRLLTVRRGYHGDTFGAMAVCDPETGMHSMFGDVLVRHYFAPEPPAGFDRPIGPSDFDEFDRLLDRHGDRVAAVIVEPVVQGAGGMRFYSPVWLAALRERCRDAGVLFIADEIATGFGRSGALFACDHADVVPDILCVGKALTGGYMTLAATLCTSDVAAAVSAAESGALMHGPTFMANPLAVSAALASLGLLATDDWAARVAGIHDELVAALDGAESIDGVTDVRVLGAIGVIELDEPVDMAVAQRVSLAAGVWLRPFGRLVYSMPPYISSADDVRAIGRAMVEIARKPR